MGTKTRLKLTTLATMKKKKKVVCQSQTPLLIVTEHNISAAGNGIAAHGWHGNSIVGFRDARSVFSAAHLAVRANAHHVAHDLVLGRRQNSPVPQYRGLAVGAVLESARQYPGAELKLGFQVEVAVSS